MFRICKRQAGGKIESSPLLRGIRRDFCLAATQTGHKLPQELRASVAPTDPSRQTLKLIQIRSWKEKDHLKLLPRAVILSTYPPQETHHDEGPKTRANPSLGRGIGNSP